MDVRKLRRAARMTQYELSKRTEISRMKLSLIECGYHNPSAEEMLAIQQATLADAQERLEELNRVRESPPDTPEAHKSALATGDPNVPPDANLTSPGGSHRDAIASAPTPTRQPACGDVLDGGVATLEPHCAPPDEACPTLLSDPPADSGFSPDWSQWCLKTCRAYPSWLKHEATAPDPGILHSYLAALQRESPAHGGMLGAARWLMAVAKAFAAQHRGKNPQSLPFLGLWLDESQYLAVEMSGVVRG